MLVILLMLLASIVLLILIGKYFDSPMICPECKKEFQVAHKEGFTEYYWSSRCPHCGAKLDDIPS